MITNTSLEAYISILPSLGSRQLVVYETIKKLEYCNNSMISKYLHLPINQITPRTNELRKKGLVKFSHTTTCPITRRKSKFWKLSKLKWR